MDVQNLNDIFSNEINSDCEMINSLKKWGNLRKPLSEKLKNSLQSLIIYIRLCKEYDLIPYNIEHFSDELKNDKIFMLKCILEYIKSYQFVNEDIKNDISVLRIVYDKYKDEKLNISNKQVFNIISKKLSLLEIQENERIMLEEMPKNEIKSRIRKF